MEAPEFQLAKTTFLIEGIARPDGPNRLLVDGVELFPAESQKIRNHSPDGWNWGYGGSGPAQTALGLCLHLFGNRFVAEALYQRFKETFVSQWRPTGESFQVRMDVADFLIDHRERLREALQREEWAKEDALWMQQADEE